MKHRNVGEFIEWYRLTKCKETLREFAARFDVSNVYIKHLENNKNLTPYNFLETLIPELTKSEREMMYQALMNGIKERIEG